MEKKLVRPHRKWVDDTKDWCTASQQELSHSAQDRAKWIGTTQFRRRQTPTGAELKADDDNMCRSQDIYDVRMNSAGGDAFQFSD